MEKETEGEFDIKHLIVEEQSTSSGGQGKVFKGKYKNDIEVIIKQYSSIGEKDNKEIAIYKELKHDFIVEFFGSFVDEAKRVNLVLEKAKGEDIDYYVRNQIEFQRQGLDLSNFNEEEKQKLELKLLTVKEKLIFIIQLCDVLIYFKKKKIIHRDVKPSNININKYLNNNDRSFYNSLLYSDSFKKNIFTLDELKCKLSENNENNENIEGSESVKEVVEDMQNLNIQGHDEKDKYYDKYNVEMKIFDFGISKITAATFDITNSNSYSIHYSCPEQYEINTEDEDVNNYLVCHKVDIWALGCLISYLFTGIVPWTNKCSNNVMRIQNALVKKIAFPIPDKWFPIDDLTKSRLIKILELCLKTSYKERINSKGLKKLILALFFDKDFDSTLLEMKNIESEYFR